ncbi:MAG: CvpA family protein [Bacteroidaceae bacterium]|nr:CvpA family protein [Bacteroidaceae bacterium]
MVELLCLAILLYGTWRGWKNGLLKEVISFLGFFLGLYYAYYHYKEIGYGIFGFLLIWIGVPLVLGILAWAITKVLDHIIIIGKLNKLLGAIVGCLKYALLLGCLLLVIDYVREAKSKFEDNGVVKALQAVPNVLFPDVNKEVENGGEE